ncbi:nuclear factor of activated T-cells 5 [Mytilus galloprovincialis]|uniref:Nuclear factor of activated T-cells 5 n=1 Tax=Mytilus galloprovincialis TaxID=29158 RepID=A0A8B6ETN0_MYTGA|nr:nuclear factor of activated T-cells 5 [Mytilus galloprovincialis]
MDINSSVYSATIQPDMNSSPFDTTEQDQSVFRTPESPTCIGLTCSNPLTVKVDQTDSPHTNSQISSPQSVHCTSPLSDPFISSTSNLVDSDFNLLSSGQNLTSFSSAITHPTTSTKGNSGMHVEQLLTCSVSTNMIPRICSPQDSLISSPVNGSDTILSSPDGNVMDSANTEYTLLDRAGRFNINDSDSPNFDGVRFDHENDHGFEQLLDYVVTDSDSHKVPKVRRDSDAPSSINKEDVTVDKLFEADLANSTAEFSFSKFGSEVSQGIFTFGGNKPSGADTTSTNTTLLVTSAISAPTLTTISTTAPVTPITRSQRGRHLKEPSLCQQYPSRTDKYELRILEQPEEQHRARYLTEGSRGAIKNVSQEGNPAVKLFGEVDNATLQVFIGNDQGRVKPHAFYQACKVCGKNSTPCQEREIDGTIVIEMEMDTANEKTCSIDNVGILKLRNADVENRVGIQKAKKKSTKARLIFRVQFQKPDGNIQILQIASRSINCTQPIGQPEICKMSSRECIVNGNAEMIMIGKNFMKGTKVFFQELNGEDGPVVWEKESELDKDFFQPTHLVCTIPPYSDTSVANKITVQVVVRCSGKQSEPQTFTYTPVFQVKQETPMETDDEPVQQNPGPLNITIAPEALRLNQQLQESLATSHGKFLLPDGTVPGVTSMQVDQHSSDQKPDKPLTLQEMLSHPTQISCPSSFPPISNVMSLNISVANSDQTNHLTNASPVQQHSEVTSPQQPVNSPLVNALSSTQGFSGMMFNSLPNNQPQSYENTGVYGVNNSEVKSPKLEQSDSDKVMTSTESDKTFEQIIGNANNQHDFISSQNNTEIISNFHSDLNSCQNIPQSPGNNQNLHQTLGSDQNLQQTLGSNQNLHQTLGSDQNLQQTLGSNQNLQQTLGSNQNLQQTLGSNQNLQQTFGSGQNLQQTLGSDQNLQQTLGNNQNLQQTLGSGQNLQQTLGSDQNLQQTLGSNQNLQQTFGSDQNLQQTFGSGQNLHQTLSNNDSLHQTLGSGQTLTNSPDLRQNIQQNVICVNFSTTQNTPTVSNIQNSAQVLQGFQDIQNNTQLQGFSNLNNVPQQKQNIVMAQHMTNHEVFTPEFTVNTSEQNVPSYYVNTRQTEQVNVLQGFTNSDTSVNTSDLKTEQGYNSLSTPSNVNTNTVSVASADNTGQQSGYSDVAMRLLQQLLTKSTNSTTSVTSQVPYSSQSTSNMLYSSAPRIQPAIFTGIQSSPSTLNIPTTALQQSISSPYPQPRVQISNQGLLHHILSQGLVDKKPEVSEMSTTSSVNVKPEVQQLDSLRLQAMAQQVQQQAQQAQNSQQTSNGNQSRGPQIIVLGGNSSMPVQNPTNSTPAAGAASAPPILILAGGGGDNNNAQSQVENILRSILGSLKPGQ